MPKTNRQFLPTLLIAAMCLPAVAVAQSEPGSLDYLLGADFEPLQNQSDQRPELNSPLIMGPQIDVPQMPQSVLELPRVTMDEPAPDALVLPDLTMPTPENTGARLREDRRALKPQFETRPSEQIELLPFDNDSDRAVSDLLTQPRAVPVQPRMQSPLPRPQLQSPQALNYGSRSYSSRSRIQLVPVQIEFFSVSRGFGYQPYGGYRSGYGSGFGSGYGYNYRPPYGGYRPYGGYGGRDCPSRGRW